MSEDKGIRLAKAAKELNVSVQTIVDHLVKLGHKFDTKPTAKLPDELHAILLRDFQGDKQHKEEAEKMIATKLRREREDVVIETPVHKVHKEEEPDEILIKNAAAAPAIQPEEKPKKKESVKEEAEQAVQPDRLTRVKVELPGAKVVDKIELEKPKKTTRKKKVEEPEAVVEETPPVQEVIEPATDDQPVKEDIKEEVVASEEPAAPIVEQEQPAATAVEQVKDETIRARAQRLTGPKVLGSIQLPVHEPKKKQPVASSSDQRAGFDKKKKRKRKERDKGMPVSTDPGQKKKETRRPPERIVKEEISDKQIQDQIKATLARLSGAGKAGKFSQRAKFRRQKRDEIASAAEEAQLEKELQSKVLKVTEFVTANELAKMMNVQVTQVIATCMNLGMFVSINQRLDAETLTIVADEFGYKVEFVSAEVQETIQEEEDKSEDLLPRSPIITVMGHVDHGKTSLLDYIRKANVIAGEAGGITQHIGAYEVKLENGRKIAFLDTPGHEAFTAMRARGAKVTDIVIIVIAADDSVMPQTVEAINHAQAAGVPIVFAFSKIDKPGANANKIREALANMNILVEDWGGKYQCQEISGKTGQNIDVLLEKVLLEADLLDLKANPNKRAQGTVIEAALDKGRGIVTTILVQSGTLQVGDPMLAGCYSGRVKALFNERGQRIEQAGPSTPVQVLGMQGAPQAGDKFNAMVSEPEAREIANKRLQLQREQGLRTQKHITLDEIGRRLAIGNFKELNVIVKGDVDGSAEALSDSLLKLSNQEIQVNVVHKAVGQISESDVLLASASDAIIIGFQVRPSPSARKLAEQEQIDIRLYSIIYDAINEIKLAMEGMLAPEIEEKIVCNVEMREVFKITKVGTVAGCMVLDGKINRNTKVRIIRDGVVVYTGELASLKRFKDDVKEVAAGFECGLNIQNFNDIKVGDILEGYEQVEVKRKLEA